MPNEQDVFSFDLNESLYFEKGQEVSQMLSISLDPEISVQTFNEYVSIRGVIELRGEYERVQTDLEQDDLPLELNDQQSYRYFEQIKNEGDHVATFLHRFPVEISVPSYRVDHINDIKVSVATFDYEIPKENQLELISTIEIHGVNNETELTSEVNERTEIETEAKTETDEQQLDVLEDSFQFEVKEELFQERKEGKLGEVREEVTPEKVEKQMSESEQEPVEKDRWKYKQTQSFEEFFKEDDEESDAIEEADIAPANMDVEVEGEVEGDEVPKRKTNYLAELFSDDGDGIETTYEQMRICIVQDQDTLESISERYAIPKLQILKTNRLADDDIVEGQLLTIPLKKVKH